MSKTSPKQGTLKGFMTVGEYAKKHKKSIWSVEWSCRNGKLNCKKVGNMWVIENK